MRLSGPLRSLAQRLHVTFARDPICSWFVGFENACSRAKTHAILTSLNYVHIYARYFEWCQFLWRPKMRICKVQKAVYQQYVNCLINTWVFASLTMAVNNVRHGFLCKNIGIKHDFLWIDICWTLRVVLKPEPERRGLNDLIPENHVGLQLLHKIILRKGQVL